MVLQIHLTIKSWIFYRGLICIALLHSLDTLHFHRRSGRTVTKPEDFIESTFKLLEGKTDYEQLDNATLVLGTSGTGKTTLVQLLAGDNNKLVAVKEGGKFRIQDEQLKFGNYSQSVYPLLVIDPNSNTSFYDCAAFGSSNSLQTDIAGTYVFHN